MSWDDAMGRDLNLCKLAGMLRLRSAEFARLQLGLLGMAESQGMGMARGSGIIGAKPALRPPGGYANDP